MVLEPQAVVHHRVTTDRTTWRYFRNRCLAEGRSKAIMCGVVGEAAGLASERSYTTRVLPAAVIRNLFSPRSKGRRSRALVIITGFVLVAFGYVRGRLTPSDSAGLDG